MTIMDPRNKALDRRGALIALAVAALATALGGCGRRSTPKAPEGSTYNTEYPTRRAMGLPPEDTPSSAPKDDEDENRPEPLVPPPPAPRY